MKVLLDTNVVSVYINGRSSTLRDKLKTVSPADIHLCSIVWAELCVGIAKSSDPVQCRVKVSAFTDLFVSLSFDDAAAECYGRIRAHLERTGNLIGPNDLMIAAVAVSRQLTLITHNTDEFSRVPDLLWQDWQ